MAKRAKKSDIAKELNITLPTCWKELSPVQVSRLSFYISLGLGKVEFLTRLVLEFSNLRPHGTNVSKTGDILYVYYRRDVGNIALTADQVAALALSLEWVLSPPSLMSAPSLDGYPSPDHRLYGITLEQFITADSALAAYSRMETIDPLRVMVAALYPRKSRFDPAALQKEAQRLSFLQKWQLDAVLLWFIGVKRMLTEKYPFVFSSSSDDVVGATGGGDVLMGLLSSLNEGRIVDNEAIKQIELHEALFELNNKIKASKTK